MSDISREEFENLKLIVLALQFETACLRALLSKQGFASVDVEGELLSTRRAVLDIILDVSEAAGAEPFLLASQIETTWHRLQRLALRFSREAVAR